ncbi:MAG TPA: phosphoglycerate dehydrogenase [Chthoniobacterales bacterium]
MSKLRVLVADPISQRGVDELAAGGLLDVTVKTGLNEEQLIQEIQDVSALVIRSQTKVTAKVLEAATNLRAIGRAGVGVDNVDVEAATKRGVIVMNTPGGNTISTAEHTFSLLLAMARNIAEAHASMRAGKWDRKKFEGIEILGKTIAILGMGRIGTELARRSMAFGMRVVAYDPYLSASRARSLQVELMDDLDEILPRADFLTVHMPMTPETKNMIDARRLALCKPGIRIVNCARGGLINEEALCEALKSGHVAGAALDVYEVEPFPVDAPLRSAPNIVLTPHLAASTTEAQENVGIEIAEAIRATILEGTIRNAVNMPNIDAKTLAVVGPYLALGEALGNFLAQIAPNRCDRLNVNYSGKVNEANTTPITRTILKGFLLKVGGNEVNSVNAAALAESLGLKVVETRQSVPGDFTELLELTATAGDQTVSVAGTFFGTTPRIVTVNGRHVEAKPQGTLLILENQDVPGIVGKVGTTLGAHGVNIAGMSLSRNEIGGRALTVLNLDSVPPNDVIASLTNATDILSAKVVTL